MKPWTDQSQTDILEVIPEVDEQPVNDQTVKLSDQPTEISDNQPGVSEVIQEVVEEPTDDQATRKTLKWSDKPKDDQPTEISDNQDEQKAEDSKEKAKKARREIMREKIDQKKKARLSKKADEYRDDDGQSNDARVSSAIWRISSTEKWGQFIPANYFKINKKQLCHYFFNKICSKLEWK